MVLNGYETVFDQLLPIGGTELNSSDDDAKRWVGFKFADFGGLFGHAPFISIRAEVLTMGANNP